MKINLVNNRNGMLRVYINVWVYCMNLLSPLIIMTAILPLSPKPLPKKYYSTDYSISLVSDDGHDLDNAPDDSFFG